MTNLSLHELSRVTGGAGLSNQPAFGDPSLPSPQEMMNAKPVDNRVIEGPSKNPYPSPDMRVTSPQTMPWGDINRALSTMGIK